MELFSTDRERLAFLLETDAALDLDFETLEAQAEAERIEYLESKLKKKDEVLGELMEEHVALKKELGEL